jgi:polyhydroxyalkanoate synthesis regulator protein
MLRDGQSKMVENMTTLNPMAKMPGFDAMQAQQKAFIKAMTGGMSDKWTGAASGPAPEETEETEDLDAIKKQLAELQEKLSRLK